MESNRYHFMQCFVCRGGKDEKDGDSGSIGAITGNILGAYLGVRGIPQERIEEVGSLDTKFVSLGTKVESIRKDVLRIENKLDTNSKALFDGYSQTYEKLNVLEAKVDDISSKVEKQDVEIRVIKGAK